MQQAFAAGAILEVGERPDVIEVGVRVDEILRPHSERVEPRYDAVDFVAAVDDDRFARFGVRDDRAIALQLADRKVLDDYVIWHPKSRYPALK
jgi:hypothetical protein